MRTAGNLLIAFSVLGLLSLGALTLVPQDSQTAPILTAAHLSAAVSRRPVISSARQSATPETSATSSVPSDVTLAEPAALPEPATPITRVAIPAIGLDADVVDAALVAVDGGVTWQVPAFKVGHAQATADAGRVGNAVLLGHVTSLHSGNVFADLYRVDVGDAVQVFSDAREFDYQIVSIGAVPRTDASVLDPTPTPSVSLITCTGFWLPTIWDYTERLVVRAELSR